MPNLLELDASHLASTEECRFSVQLEQAFRADLERGDPSRSFCEAALTFVRRGGSLDGVASALEQARALRARAPGTQPSSGSAPERSQLFSDTTGSAPFPGVTSQRGGLSDHDRAAAIRLLLNEVERGAVAPLAALRFGQLQSLLGGSAHPFHEGALLWLRLLLLEAAPYTNTPRAKWETAALDAAALARLLDALGYPPSCLLEGAFGADLRDWRTPADVAALAGVGMLADQHAEVVLAALGSKNAKRLCFALEMTRLLRPRSPAVLGAVDRLLADKRRSVATPAAAVAASLRAEASDHPFEIAGWRTLTPLASFAPSREWRRSEAASP